MKLQEFYEFHKKRLEDLGYTKGFGNIEYKNNVPLIDFLKKNIKDDKIYFESTVLNYHKSINQTSDNHGYINVKVIISIRLLDNNTTEIKSVIIEEKHNTSYTYKTLDV